MLIEINTFDQLNQKELMAVYRETNMEDIRPDAPDRDDALRQAEEAYLRYLKEDFLVGPGNRCMVWSHGGAWVCALRLYRVDDELYYIGALETRPEFRRMGYAVELLTAVIRLLKERGVRTVRDCVERGNTASLRAHRKTGFVIYRDIGYDYARRADDGESYGLQYVIADA